METGFHILKLESALILKWIFQLLQLHIADTLKEQGIVGDKTPHLHKDVHNIDTDLDSNITS